MIYTMQLLKPNEFQNTIHYKHAVKYEKIWYSFSKILVAWKYTTQIIKVQYDL